MNKPRQAAVLPFFFASLTRLAAAAVPRRRSVAFAALLTAALMLFPEVATGQAVTTLAGSGALGSADGPGAAASFGAPQGVAVDQAGNVYVADTTNARIRKIAPGGDVTTLADFCCGRVYGGAVIAVAVDASGNVYATDPIGDGIDGGALYMITPGGAVTYGPGSDSPAGVAVRRLREHLRGGPLLRPHQDHRGRGGHGPGEGRRWLGGRRGPLGRPLRGGHRPSEGPCGHARWPGDDAGGFGKPWKHRRHGYGGIVQWPDRCRR